MVIEEQSAGIDLDDVLSKFKLFGHHNVKFMTLALLLTFANEIHFLNYVFAAADVDYRCQYPTENCGEDFNKTIQNIVDRKNICITYDIKEENGTCSLSEASSTQVHCDEWIYEEAESFVEEFELACQDWKRTLVGTGHGFGYMCGLFFVGVLSDKLGRKKAAIFLTLAAGVTGLVKSQILAYWAYVALEILEASFSSSVSPLYTYVVEMSSKEKRVIFTTLVQITCGISHATLAILAWSIPNWRTMTMVLYIPAVLCVLCNWSMYESIRWLLSIGRKSEALKILKKTVDLENIKTSEEELNRVRSEKKTPNLNLLPLLKMTVSSKTITIRLIACAWLWIASCFNNAGLMINSVTLPGNKYVNFILLGLIYVPANLCLLYILPRFRRKKPLMLSFLITGVLCVSQPFIPSDMSWLATLLFLLGKSSSCITGGTLYLYTSELFPTYTRNTMHALCSGLGRIGAILVPQTPLLIRYWTGLPTFLIGAVALSAGLITIVMPDTCDEVLPDTLKQAETVGYKQTPCNRDSRF